MTLKADLIAARALIDTPRKLKRMAVIDAVYKLFRKDMGRHNRIVAALYEAGHSAFIPADHAEVMALFQRAIDNA